MSKWDMHAFHETPRLLPKGVLRGGDDMTYIHKSRTQVPIVSVCGDIALESKIDVHELDIVRPFRRTLELEVRQDRRYIDAHESYVKMIETIPANALKTIDLSPFEAFGSGIQRAWFLMVRYPEIYGEDTLRIGSLGRRVGESGRLFWELG